MKFVPTALEGAYVVELEPHRDDRGFLARAYCSNEFAEHGLSPVTAQANLSHSAAAGTLRGMHWQVAPAEEAKLVRCLRGALYDVIVDMRGDSPTHRQWYGIELEPHSLQALYVPEGFAHGFLTLEDDTLAFYQVSELYTPGTERGMRHDDPTIGIEWPREVAVLSQKDASWPLLDDGSRG